MSANTALSPKSIARKALPLCVVAGLGLTLGNAVIPASYAYATSQVTDQTQQQTEIVEVSTQEELQQAINRSIQENSPIEIVFEQDIQITSTVSISHGWFDEPNVNINGNGYSILYDGSQIEEAFRITWSQMSDGNRWVNVRIDDLTFENTSEDEGSNTYAVYLGWAMSLELNDCRFINLHSAVNATTTHEPGIGGEAGTLGIYNCTLDNTKWSFSLEQPKGSAHASLPLINFENNVTEDEQAAPAGEIDNSLDCTIYDKQVGFSIMSINGLDEACRAANGHIRIELNHDVEVDVDPDWGWCVDISHSLDLDGNGFTATPKSDMEDMSFFRIFRDYDSPNVSNVVNISNITLRADGAENGSVSTVDVISILSDVDVNLKNCKLIGGISSALGVGSGNVTLSNVVLRPMDGAPCITLGIPSSTSVVAENVESCIFDGDAIAIMQDLYYPALDLGFGPINDSESFDYAPVVDKLNESGFFFAPLYYDSELRIATTNKPDSPDPEPEPEPEPTPDPDPTPVPTPDPDEDVDVPETEGGAVTVEPVPAGETATIVAEPDAGQEVRDVVVTDADGNEVETEVDEDGNVTFEMPEGGATVEVVFGCDGGELCGTHAYPDIDQDQWYHDSVDWAIEEGVFHGYDDGTFGPNDVLTREQAAAVLYNHLGGTEGSGDSGLTDVADDWYTDAVNWAVENGVMTGYEGTGTFGVGEALTREQFCAVVAKAMRVDLADVDTSVLDAFADAGSVSEWARPAVAWAVQQGIVNGVENPDGTRSLQGPRDITRAEMAAMMLNAVDAGVLVK